MNLSQAFDSVARTANQVGHQLGQYVDGQAAGGLLAMFATGNVLCLVPRYTGKALQIVAAADGRLIVDGLGPEGPKVFNTHWTVVSEGNNVVRLHNNNNYLCINNTQLCVIHCPSGNPLGAETKLRVSQSGNCWVTLESVKEPSNYVSVNQLGQTVAGCYNLAPSANTSCTRQLIPKVVYSPYGAPVPQPHTYRL